MIIRSTRTHSVAELKETNAALERIIAAYEEAMNCKDDALTSAHITLAHLTSVIAYTKNQPDQVDFDGILMRLADVIETIELGINS